VILVGPCKVLLTHLAKSLPIKENIADLFNSRDTGIEKIFSELLVLQEE
jgi:hypothetical protein